MGWLSWVRSKNGTGNEGADSISGKGKAANGYDAALVPKLSADHKDLLSLYNRIGQLFDAGTYEEIPNQLMKFKTRIEGHLLTENFRFYTYLEEQLASDSGSAELMRDFRKEMNSIARTVMGFIRTYHNSGVTADNAKQFIEEYRKIAKALAHRIEREERNLYPMYVPPRA